MRSAGIVGARAPEFKDLIERLLPLKPKSTAGPENDAFRCATALPLRSRTVAVLPEPRPTPFLRPVYRVAGPVPSGTAGTSHRAAMFRCLPAAVCGHPRRVSHSQASQTGRLSRTAQTATATGPSRPANSVAATVTAPSPMPVAHAARR